MHTVNPDNHLSSEETKHEYFVLFVFLFLSSSHSLSSLTQKLPYANIMHVYQITPCYYSRATVPFCLGAACELQCDWHAMHGHQTASQVQQLLFFHFFGSVHIPVLAEQVMPHRAGLLIMHAVQAATSYSC